MYLPSHDIITVFVFLHIIYHELKVQSFILNYYKNFTLSEYLSILSKLMSEIMVFQSTLKHSACWKLVHSRKMCSQGRCRIVFHKRCWAATKCGQSMETKARSGRLKILNRAAKIVISKSFLDNLVSSMPNRIRKVPDSKGDWVFSILLLLIFYE